MPRPAPAARAPSGRGRALARTARRQTRYMAVHDVWDHDVGGCGPNTWVDGKQHPWTSFGQTLSRGEGRQSTAPVVAGWLASKQGHCETLMMPKWRSMGVAYVRDGSVHLWTAIAERGPEVVGSPRLRHELDLADGVRERGGVA